jgi:hypothetical protein
MTIDLSRRPWPLRDPAFRRRREALSRCETEAQRNEVLAQPLVAERTFTPGLEVDCPKGDVDDHAADWPPVNHAGRPAIARTCHRCGGTWLELIA